MFTTNLSKWAKVLCTNTYLSTKCEDKMRSCLACTDLLTCFDWISLLIKMQIFGISFNWVRVSVKGNLKLKCEELFLTLMTYDIMRHPLFPLHSFVSSLDPGWWYLITKIDFTPHNIRVHPSRNKQWRSTGSVWRLNIAIMN